MPTVKYPLYFRYVLNSLSLFLVLCFCFKKRKSDGCHMSAHPAVYRTDRMPFHHSCHFFGASVCLNVWVQYEIREQRDRKSVV